MAVIYHVEHGDTAYDEKDCAQGLIDAGLSTRGRSQVKRAAALLKGTGIDCVYCSPLKRAEESAKIIAGEIGAKVIVRNNLQPLDIGALAGKKESQVAGYLDFYSKRPTLSFPEGESFGKFYERARKEWRHQFADDDPVIAVVSHSRDAQLLQHWAKSGMDAGTQGIAFIEPLSAQVLKAKKRGNRISLQKVG